MTKWPWLPGPTKRLHVKVKPLKLEGFYTEFEKERERNVIVLKMKWKGPKSGLAPFCRASTCQRNYSSPKFSREGGQVEWDNEFESICNFWVGSKDKSFSPWDVSFNVLYVSFCWLHVCIVFLFIFVYINKYN